MKNVFSKIPTKMKSTRFFLFSLCLFCMVPVLQAQNSEVPGGIIVAIEAGNAGQLSSYLSDNVELVIGNQNDVFSRLQAASIIADFFHKNKVNSFQLLHKGNKDAASFAIGTLKTSTGIFRVYVLTRKNQIQQLRIELSND
jgi:hypothetical protein